MIHYFNPGHETAVLNQSPYYMAPANVASMQRELAFLPAWYAHCGDSVLIVDPLGNEFEGMLQMVDFQVHPITEDKLATLSGAQIVPWGVSPQVIHYFEELSTTQNSHFQTSAWNERLIHLNSRLFARDCLQKIGESIPDISEGIQPQIFRSLSDIHAFLESTNSQHLAKAPFSSSGRGLLWLPKTGLTRTENQILHGILKKQKSISIEKVLDKKIDFAMEFLSDGEKRVDFLGYSLFQTNEKGGYVSNSLCSQDKIEKLLTEKIPGHLLVRVKEVLTNILTKECASIYKGCIGVDMMIYSDEKGHRLHPCLEINLRYNMGYLSLCLNQNYLAESSEGHFFLDFDSLKEGIFRKHKQMIKEHPLLIDENKKIRSGYLPLCPINQSTRFWAYALIK